MVQCRLGRCDLTRRRCDRTSTPLSRPGNGHRETVPPRRLGGTVPLSTTVAVAQTVERRWTAPHRNSTYMLYPIRETVASAVVGSSVAWPETLLEVDGIHLVQPPGLRLLSRGVRRSGEPLRSGGSQVGSRPYGA